jgi:hypothetical protein
MRFIHYCGVWSVPRPPLVGPAGQENTDTDSMDSRDTDNSDNNNLTSVCDDERGLDNRSFQPEVSRENHNRNMESSWTVSERISKRG